MLEKKLGKWVIKLKRIVYLWCGFPVFFRLINKDDDNRLNIRPYTLFEILKQKKKTKAVGLSLVWALAVKWPTWHQRSNGTFVRDDNKLSLLSRHDIILEAEMDVSHLTSLLRVGDGLCSIWCFQLLGYRVFTSTRSTSKPSKPTQGSAQQPFN